jgi:hypothetical protein
MVLFFTAALLGVLIGFLRGGTISNLAQLHLRGTWLILIALLIQLAIFPLGSRPLIELDARGIMYAHLASYLFLILFVVFNRREWSLWPIALGMLANFLVIAVNQGHMPAALSAVEASGAHQTAQALREKCYHANIVLMNPDGRVESCPRTHLNALGDIIPLPAWLPLARPLSPGDLLLALGLLFFLPLKMRGR